MKQQCETLRVMSKYFFNIRHGEQAIADTVGSEFDDLDHARGEATQAARELLCEALKFRVELGACEIEICDEGGHQLTKVPLTEIIDQAYPDGYPINRRYSASGTP